jgi:glutathione S-transferase
MLLLGQFESPFVRRVGIALRLYGYDFEHRPYSVFRDAEQIAAFNPLRRVPTLVLEDGTVLTETFVCLEVVDERVAHEHPDKPLLLARSGPQRREGLRVAALCGGTCDKAVSLVYERVVREQASAVWSARCHLQVRDALAAIEATFAQGGSPYLFGDAPSHADIAASCMLTFIAGAHPGYLDAFSLPALRALNARVEAWPEAQQTLQPFDVPLPT